MKRNIKFLPILLLLMIISLSTVLADDDIAIEDNNNETSATLIVAEYTITESNYGDYFDAEGNLQSNVNNGDKLTLSGDFISKDFKIDKNITISGNNALIIGGTVVLKSGASGSSISNLKIINVGLTDKRGFLLNGVNNCLIQNNNVYCSGESSFSIALTNNSNYNMISNNIVKTGTVSAIILGGANNNLIKDNYIEINNTKGIYLSKDNSGSFSGGECYNNVILNNTIKSITIPTSSCYGIQISSSNNTVKDNKIIGTYRGIDIGDNSLIIGNVLSNITGKDASGTLEGGKYVIYTGSNCQVLNNTLENCAITASGILVFSNSTVQNNYVDVGRIHNQREAIGIRAEGNNIKVLNNTIFCGDYATGLNQGSAYGVLHQGKYSNLLVSGNVIHAKTVAVKVNEGFDRATMSTTPPNNYTIVKNTVYGGIDAYWAGGGSYVMEDNKVISGNIKLPNKKTLSSVPVNITFVNPEVNVGNNVTLKINVTDKNNQSHNGTAKIIINDAQYGDIVDVVNGSAEVNIVDYAVGNYAVDVFFNEDSHFGFNTAGFYVKQITTMLNITFFNQEDATTILLNLTDSIGNPVGGNVKVNVTQNNGYNYSTDVTIVNGTGSLTINDLLNGHYSVMAEFTGTTNYTDSIANNSFNIAYTPKSFNLTAFDVIKDYKNGTQYIVKITDDKGNKIANKTVDIILSSPKWDTSPSYTISSDENGIATLDINLAPGNYSIKAISENCTISNNISVLKIAFKLESKDITKPFGDKTSYTVKVTDNKGNIMVNEAVTIDITSSSWSKPVSYKLITNNEGVATLPINLNPGNYSIKAVVGDSIEYSTITIMKAAYNLKVEDIVKYFKNGTQYTVKVTDVNGTAVVGATISVSISSSSWKKPATYKITTNDEGVANLDINLATGKYSMTANLGGNIAKSTVEVLPTLTVNSIAKKVSQPASLKAKLVDGQGNPLSGKTITFKVLDKTYYRTTDNNGFTSLPIHLNLGVWKFIITNPETGASTLATVKVIK